MNKAEIIASLALFVSIISLGFSAHFGLRDRGKLKATSRFYAASEYGPAKIVVILINTGRRPINLRLLGGSDKDGRWSGQFFGDYKEDFYLNEHGRHEVTMNREDLGAFNQDDIIQYEVLWVEDSLGNKHPVKDSKENIAKVWAS